MTAGTIQRAAVATYAAVWRAISWRLLILKICGVQPFIVPVIV